MRLSPHVCGLKVPFKVPVAPGQDMERFVYCYAVIAERVCLIDTGVAGSEQRIYGCLAELGRGPSDIATIVLTHSHPDHIGGAARIVRDMGCRVLVPEPERGWLEDVETQFKERPVPGFRSLVGGSVAADDVVRDGDEIDLGSGMSLRAISTPGHSAGSTSYYLKEDRALFTGDALPVPGDMPVYEDVPATVRSIAALSGEKGAERLFSAWDDPHEGERVRLSIGSSMGYVQRLHDMVRRLATERYHTSLMDLTRCVQVELGLPPQAANPIMARTVEAHLRARCVQDLSELADSR